MKSIKFVITIAMSLMMLVLSIILVTYAANEFYEEKKATMRVEAKQSLVALDSLTQLWYSSKKNELEYMHSMIANSEMSEDDVRYILQQSLTDQDLKNAYVGYSDGRFILNSLSAQQKIGNSGYTPTTRKWYQEALAAGKPVLVSPYLNGDGSNEVVTTIAIPLVVNGKTKGVIGIDSSVSKLQNLLRSIPIPSKTQVMMVDAQDKILAHSSDIELLTSTADISSIIPVLTKNRSSTSSQNEIVNGIDSYIITMPVLDNWSIVMILNRDALVAPLNSSIVALLVFAVVNIAVAVAFISYITTILIKPLVTVNKHLNTAANGSGDLTVRLKQNSNDEVGQICQSFNAFNTTLQDMVNELSNSMNEVTDTSEKVKLIATETSKNVGHQQLEIEQISTAVHEMNAAAYEIAQNIARSAEESDIAERNIQEGSREVTETTKKIQYVSEQILNTADIADNLNGEITQISSVVEVISKIAEQTNLLALNAAIEAARAGENGRGFAIVADEVRNLAQKTQLSTEDIRKTIDSLQTKSRDLVSIMEDNRVLTNETTDQANIANIKLEKVVDSIRTISDMSMQIASASEEQHIVSEDIGKNIESIHILSREVTKQAKQTDEASMSLINVVDKANKQLSMFKV
ncbi:methyl-accepting chemotaxis protein [Photobacterium sanguinicancri]|uniref:methyl-accepting chemotaxis protein n=1 Tax=Photobacterium sanguinicancri TaxID=875932 RepID=UPI0026E3A369|nr:methyl-accepting chemotaxis protein [Photobacterium sanguinicancri]MDO6500437.1 methyl-accepting chemotaxis protein [Photobacterium sanguinicancri]